eukprot:CFRG8180T1
MSVYTQIEAGLGTDLKALHEAAETTRLEISRADRALADFLKGEDLNNLGIDLENLNIDEDGIVELEKHELANPDSRTKKFVSPYLDSALVKEAEAQVEPTPKVHSKKKGAFSFFGSEKDKDKEKKITKKDLKAWNECLQLIACEEKTRHGLEKLFEVYRLNPEKGSAQASNELSFQIMERERKIRVLKIGLDQAIPPELYKAEHTAAYEKIFDHTRQEGIDIVQPGITTQPLSSGNA